MQGATAIRFRSYICTGMLMSVVLAMTTGCEPDTVEESQARRMQELSGQSYTEQALKEHPTEPGEPMILPAARDEGSPLAP